MTNAHDSVLSMTSVRTKPVLVATHLRPQAVAAQLRGAALARAMKAPLQLLHVLPPFSSKRAQSSAKAQIRLAAARLRQAFDVPVHPALAQGLVASCIARRSREVAARLIVLGAERPSLLGELRPGRAHAVRQRAGVPVLAVSRGRDETYRRVILASDLCTDDASALAALHRQFPDAALHVVHVLQWHLSRPLRHAFIPDEVLAGYRVQVREAAASRLRRVAQARRDVAPTVSVEATIQDVILALRVQAGQFGADLLVVSPEQSWLKAALGISVAQRVLANPPCDVLLLPRVPASAPTLYRRMREA
jgi:nucleotide-binding universal stress UspA family protein